MQAMFVFALFGMFFTVVSGLVAGTSVGTMQLMEEQVQDTQAYFKRVGQLVNNYQVMQNIRLPDVSSNPENLFDWPAVARGANWPWGPRAQDPWGSDITAHFVYENHIVAAGMGGIVVQPQASAILLASPGPDRTFHPTLQARIGSLSGSSSINQVMNVEAVDNTDDIVYTFNTRQALEYRWNDIAHELDKLAVQTEQQYRGSMSDTNFQTNLETYYDALINQELSAGGGATVDASGNLTLLCAGCDPLENVNLEQWKTQFTGIDSAIQTNLTNTAPDADALDASIASVSGDGATLDYLTEAGLQLTPVAQAKTGGSITDDQLQLNVSSIDNRWRSSGGAFHYHVIVGDTTTRF